MTGRILTGHRHDLQITYRPRSSWPLVLAGLVIVIIARGL